jgi:hypothetical protein
MLFCNWPYAKVRGESQKALIYGIPKKLLGQFFVCHGHIVQGTIQAYDAVNLKKGAKGVFCPFLVKIDISSNETSSAMGSCQQ